MAKNFIEIYSKNFPLFAEHFLKIAVKGGGVHPFKLNSFQLALDREIEYQKETRGYVRINIIKARQVGMSTYVEGKFFHEMLFRTGINAFILTHKSDSTTVLFNKVKTFYDCLPEVIKPHLGKSNEGELYFDKLQGLYRVGTAKSKQIGRGMTIQLAHLSEVAFYPSADIAAGLMQSIADVPGTMIICESTSNGQANYWHNMVLNSERDLTIFKNFFVPWIAFPEYTMPVEKELVLDAEEQALKTAYNLTDGQLNFRRLKIAEFQAAGENGTRLFKQEYPATLDESFQASSLDSFIPNEFIQRARMNKDIPAGRPKILGIDSAKGSEGGDRSTMVYREGRKVTYMKAFKGVNTMAFVGLIADFVRLHPEIDKIVVETDGLGVGVYDRLCELNFKEKMLAVVSGSHQCNTNRFASKKSEMWYNMRLWFASEAVSIPDDKELCTDLSIPLNKPESSGKIVIESKRDIKKRGMPSPDLADGLAITFAYEIFTGDQKEEPVKVDYTTTDLVFNFSNNNIGWLGK